MQNFYKYDVSICCATFNQSRYIENTLNGFLKQRENSNLKIEIIIHDDCSTDGTDNILKKFDQENENVKLILQKENQYSKGRKIVPILVAEAEGKYIAFCEGDDYWTDSEKVRIQYEYMEKHKECSLCAHAAEYVNNEGVYLKDYTCSNQDAIIPFEKIVKEGGNFIPTLSLFYRRDDVTTFPEAYLKCPVGDYPLQIYLSQKGYCFYINRKMGSYRVSRSGSMTDSLNKDDRITLELYERLIEMLNTFDKMYDFKYKELFQETILEYEYLKLRCKGDYAAIKSAPFIDIYNKQNYIEKLKIYIKCKFPTIFKKAKNYAKR